MDRKAPIPPHSVRHVYYSHRLLPIHFFGFRSAVFHFVGLSLLTGLGCNARHERAQDSKTVKPVAVVRGETYVVKPLTWPKRVRVQGSLIPDETAAIGAKVSGKVIQVHADLGDRIEQGSPLVTIDDSQYKLLVAQAEAELQQARSAVGLREGDPLEKLEPNNAAPVREARAVWDEAQQSVQRVRKLALENAISETDVEVAESAERVAAARLTSAENGVREKLAMIASQTSRLGLARENLIETVVRAPFSGLIQNREAAVGTYVQTGQTLFTLMRLSPIRFRSAVPERYAHLLRIDQEVRIKLELSLQEYRVKIARISPALDPLNRSLAFEALIDNSDQSLRSGLFAEADVILDPDSQALAIPSSCLVRFAGVDKVWKISDGMIKEQVVLLGQQANDLYEIVAGLKSDDVILLDGEQGKIGRFESKADEKAETTDEANAKPESALPPQNSTFIPAGEDDHVLAG